MAWKYNQNESTIHYVYDAKNGVPFKFCAKGFRDALDKYLAYKGVSSNMVEETYSKNDFDFKVFDGFHTHYYSYIGRRAAQVTTSTQSKKTGATVSGFLYSNLKPTGIRYEFNCYNSIYYLICSNGNQIKCGGPGELAKEARNHGTRTNAGARGFANYIYKTYLLGKVPDGDKAVILDAIEPKVKWM